MKKRIVLFILTLAVLVLAACGSSPSYTPGSQQIAAQEAYNAGDLYHLAAQERWDLVIRMLNAGSFKDINSQKTGIYNVAIGESTGFSGGGTLHSASYSGRLDVVRLLVEKGADKNIRNPYSGGTPLMAAASNGFFDIVRYLVEQGANVNLRDNNGQTAASYAYDKGEVEIYDYLMEHGARAFDPLQVTQTPQQQQAAPTTVIVQPSAPAQAAPSTPSSPTALERAQEALRPVLTSGTYGLANSQTTIMLTSIARTGSIYYTNLNGNSGTGNYTIDGDRMTIRMEGYTFVYTITSQTSFEGNGEVWTRIGGFATR
jgi:ankyrin repeat protein/predicted small lipoprotein YifL